MCAVEAWSEQVVIVLAGAILITFLAKLIFTKSVRFIWSWAYIPIIIFILIAVFQLLPLPSGLAAIISPNTAAIKTELLGDLPNSDQVLDRLTITFYTNATKHDLRLILALASVFIVVLNIFHRPAQVKRILAAITIIGGIIAILTLAQDLLEMVKFIGIYSHPAQAEQVHLSTTAITGIS